MNTKEILDKIDQYMVEHSNFDEHRDYLGISHVAGCPRRAYDNYLQGMQVGENTYRMSFTGYDQEKSVRAMLDGWVSGTGVEVVAPFDNRLRGHIDGLLRDGDLLEIKSVTVRKYQKIVELKKAVPEHFGQLQLYMRYGNFERAFIIYRCRETYEHTVLRVPYLPDVAEKLEEKARRILQAIDSQTPPACECGHCK